MYVYACMSICVSIHMYVCECMSIYVYINGLKFSLVTSTLFVTFKLHLFQILSFNRRQTERWKKIAFSTPGVRSRGSNFQHFKIHL